jgi:hypothetical protein
LNSTLVAVADLSVVEAVARLNVSVIAELQRRNVVLKVT